MRSHVVLTLVEMLVVITISAILVAAAVPALQWTITRNRISDATNTLMSKHGVSRVWKRRGLGNLRFQSPALFDPNAAPAPCSQSCYRERSMATTGQPAGSCLRRSLPNADEAQVRSRRQIDFPPAISEVQVYA